MFLPIFYPLGLANPLNVFLCFMFFVKFSLIDIVNLQSYDLNKKALLSLPQGSGRDMSNTGH